MMNRKTDIHTEIEELLTQKSTLWPDELERVENHLETCEQCRGYAVFLEEMSERDWNPYPAEQLDPQQKQEVLNSIEFKRVSPYQQRTKWRNAIGNPRATVVTLFATVLFSLFAFVLFTGELAAFQFRQQAYFYDGYELGVSFFAPNEWSYATFYVPEEWGVGSVMILADRDLSAEEKFDLRDLAPGESRALVMVKNPKYELSGDLSKDKVDFSKYWSDVSSYSEEILFAGHETLFIENMHLSEQFVSATFFVDSRLVRILARAAPDESRNIIDLNNWVEQIANSMQQVDHTGWDFWEHSNENLTMLIPTGATMTEDQSGLFASLNLDESYPAMEWRVWFDESAGNKTRLDHFNSLNGDVDFDIPSYLPREFQATSMEQIGAIEHLNFHSGKRIALYKLNEDQHLLAAAMINPMEDLRRPILVTTLLVNNKEDVETIRPTFEDVVRSIRGSSIPIIPPKKLIDDPNINLEFSFEPRDYGSKMILDPGEMLFSIQKLQKRESGLSLEFYFRPKKELIDKALENYFFVSTKPVEGQLINSNGETYQYKGGAFYGDYWNDSWRVDAKERNEDETYHPPNNINFEGNSKIDTSLIYTLSTDVVLYGVIATENINLDLSGYSWGDSWENTQQIYFNGLSLMLTEASLNEDEQTLEMKGTINSSNVPYQINSFYSHSTSGVKFKTSNGLVELTYDIQEIPEGELSLLAIATIEYENAASINFRLAETGEIVQIEN